MKNVLVIAVHPDDETLGCGGTLLRHKNEGDDIHWCIATTAQEEYGFERNFIKQRKKEIDTVAKTYQFNSTKQLDFPTTNLDQVAMSDLIKAFSKIICEIKPEIIYLPFKYDIHSDHQIVFQAAFSCTKIFRYTFIRKILMMETISETEFAPAFSGNQFLPNYFVNITSYIEKKIDILSCYRTEIEQHPFPRSRENIKALAKFRGAMAGCNFAESFMLLKEIK